MKEPILSIGITSYKRVRELERCINSVDTKYADDVEIIVSEDCSPLSEEIGRKVEDLRKSCKYNIKFMPNEHNLGYDRNLAAIIQKSEGKFVFLISDDDAIFGGFLDVLIPFLKTNGSSYGVLYSPFVYTSSKKKDRDYGKNMVIEKGVASCKKHVYDSILFSGLIFRKECVIDLDAERFLNMNYFQVYMFLKTLYKYGGYYFAIPSVWCVGDGENAYGLSESSGGNNALQNRKSVISNLEFNKTLVKVIKIFDEDEGTDISSSFGKQYSRHSISGLLLARSYGFKYYQEYWAKLKEVGVKLSPIAYLYYLVVLLLGKKVSAWITGFRKYA